MTTTTKMDKMLEVILPKVILDTISNFVFYVLPKHGKILKNNYLVYMTKYYSYGDLTLYQYQYKCDKTGDVLEDIGESSDMMYVVYLHDIGELSKKDIVEREIFIGACGNGHYDLVEYLTKTYELTYDDVSYDDDKAFGIAYINGHYDVADHLKQTFYIKCHA